MKVVLHQNYFQYNNKYYKPSTGIAVGCPLSSTAIELLLQYFEELFINYRLEAHNIVYYQRYVDDIPLNSYNQNLAFTPTL
jgi:hypothetical protein